MKKEKVKLLKKIIGVLILVAIFGFLFVTMAYAHSIVYALCVFGSIVTLSLLIWLAVWLILD